MSATLALVARDRTREQRLTALERANRTRVERAQLKRDLKAGRVQAVDLFLSPPDCILSMRVFDLLRALPSVGRVKAGAALNRWGVSQGRMVGDLSDRQRVEIASCLRAGRTR